MTKRHPVAPHAPATPLSAECLCRSPSRAAQRVAKWVALAGLLGSLGVCAACCLLPFALISIGVTGAWISGLETFAPYKWLLIILTFAFLGYGFQAAYRRPKRSSGAHASEDSLAERSVRLWLWLATVLAICGIVFGHIEPLLRK